MPTDLKSLLKEYGCPEDGAIQQRNISDSTITFIQLRDRLLLLGEILYEDVKSQIYVASIHTGLGDMSHAIVAMHLKDDLIESVGYAKEGIIKQDLCEKAFRKLEDAAHGKQISSAHKVRRLFPIVIAVMCISAFVMIRHHILYSVDPEATNSALVEAESSNESQASTQEEAEKAAYNAEVELTIKATKAYNSAVKEYNTQVEAYNEAAALTCLDNIAELPESFEKLSIESETFEDNAKVVQGANSKEIIQADTQTIRDMTKQIEQATVLVKQVTAPSGDWVYERLANVDDITGRQQVTESMNPDGLLGKEGGYSSCVYFAVLGVNQNEVPGNSIVEKGTDAGGAIEVYPSLADAEQRVEYLSGFDGTVLYSGSYAIVGTMVIRTSYKLTDEQQFELTNKITSVLTAIDLVE